MLTRNELLDRLISVLSEKKEQLFENWHEFSSRSYAPTSWKQSYHFKEYERLEVQIMELMTQYD